MATNSLFPSDFYDNTINNSTNTQLPMLYDYLIDLETGHLILDEYGRASIVSGANAIIMQTYRKLHIPKDTYYIYPNDYGSSLKDLIGKGKAYADSVISEYLIKALVDNKYVLRVSNIITELNGNNYNVNFTMTTVYGDISCDMLDVDVSY